MEADGVGMNIQEKLSGFIFMCNRMTKPECYRFRVFGLPAGRKEIVEKISPGAYLFLFDTDVKLLYGTYMATSTGRLQTEPLAFGGRFPAQVRFKIYKDCLPLPENCFKHAIQDNYQKDSNKFNPELNIRQVRSLLELFRPLHVLSTAPTHPVLNEIYSPSMLPPPPVHNVFHQISRSSLSEDSFLSRMSPNQAPRLLNYKHVNELEESTGHAYPANNLMRNSVAAQSVPSQASRNQIHAPASTVTAEGTYAARMVSSYTLSPPDPQYTHRNILNLQTEFHSSLMNKGSGHTSLLQDSQHAHLNVLHPQPEFHSSMMTMGSSYAQSLQDHQHANLNVLHPQPEFHSSMTTMGSSYAQSLQDPQHPHQSILNPPPDFHFPVANVGSSHTQMSWDPHYTHQNILNSQPNSYSSAANMGSSYAQSLPYPQHTHQEAQNPQPDYSSSLVNMDPANALTQSHAWSSSLYYPYVPQEVVSAATYSAQGSGAIQEVTSSGQQAGMGSEYYQSSIQTQNISAPENVASHLYSANSYSLC